MDTVPPGTPHLLNNGLGCDSAAYIFLILQYPELRPCPLEDLIVVSAQTGNESRKVKAQTEKHLYPRLKAAGVLTAQVARASAAECHTENGITVLDCTTEPDVCFVEGDYSIVDHHTQYGGVPQYANGHVCAIKFKGEVLQEFKRQLFGDRLVVSLIQYNADELGRLKKAREYGGNQPGLITRFPLVEQGLGRADTERIASETAGEPYERSACLIWPFGVSAGSRAETLQRHRDDPEASAKALFMEFMSLAMNPRQSLFKRRTLRSLLEADGNTITLTLFEQALNAPEWAVYRVRRLKLGKHQHWRSLVVVSTGSRLGCELAVHALNGHRVSHETHVRHVMESRWKGDLPWREQFVVAAPHLVAAKARPSFEQKWFESHQTRLTFKRQPEGG